MGIFTKIPNHDLFRLKISRNISHHYEKKMLFSSNDPIIQKLEKLETIVVDSATQYKFEKDFSQLVIIPLHNNHQLLGFLFIDRSYGSFNDLEFTLLEIHSSIVSLGICLHQQRQLIEELQQTEEITGMYKYEAFCQHAEYIFALMHKTKTPLTATVFKVDDYNQILRTFGLEAIHYTAAKLAEILRNSLSATDILGKVYKDTVAILMPATTSESATEKIKKIDQKFQKNITLHKIKIGWGIVSCECTNVEQLIRMAEQAAFESTRKRDTNITVLE
jgi:diguanylate cyclase (GGDEF)-like protein